MKGFNGMKNLNFKHIAYLITIHLYLCAASLVIGCTVYGAMYRAGVGCWYGWLVSHTQDLAVGTLQAKA